ncbi:MAG TPA: lipopolysaccharide biosynthesis protein [Patescibacteria group bacterium]|nr:lipopolysaccharide biosynthesis protein [Patescibacteria group bacterium]
MGYTRDAIRGISWMSGFRAVTRGMAFVKIAVLARVLSPAQFGVFGIASLVLTFLEVITETGINVFLIQSKKTIDDYIDSAWVVSIIRGIIISLLLVILSPVIASFFNTPEALPILLFISIVPFIKGFINPACVKFQKELQFNAEFWYRTAIFFVDSVIAIVIAYFTHSVYSLVWGLLAGAMIEVLLSFLLFRPTPRLHIENNYFMELFHKGKWVTLSGIFGYFTDNGDNVVVGKLLGASNLGLYQLAYKISILPISEVSDVVSRVIFPVYTKIAEDKRRLWRAFVKTNIFAFSASFTLGMIIFFFPAQIVLIFLGDKWLAAVPVLQVLSIYGVLRTIAGPSSSLFLAVGKQQYVTGMILVRLLALGVTIFPLISLYGLVGAAYAAIISVLIETPVVVYFVYRVFAKSR